MKLYNMSREFSSVNFVTRLYYIMVRVVNLVTVQANAISVDSIPPIAPNHMLRV